MFRSIIITEVILINCSIIVTVIIILTPSSLPSSTYAVSWDMKNLCIQLVSDQFNKHEYEYYQNFSIR